MVEPVHPFQGRELDGVEVLPRPTPMDDLGLVEPVDGLGERVVIAVADAADRGLDARFRQPLGVANGDVLGGFNRSSQHRGIRGMFDGGSTAFGSGFA
jgi:hypothetical protein